MAAHTRRSMVSLYSPGLQEALQRSAVLETQIQTAQTKVTELETRAQALLQSLSKNGVHAASTARGEALSRQVDELKAGAIEEQAFQRRVGKRTCSY